MSADVDDADLDVGADDRVDELVAEWAIPRREARRLLAVLEERGQA